MEELNSNSNMCLTDYEMKALHIMLVVFRASLPQSVLLKEAVIFVYVVLLEICLSKEAALENS